MILVFPYIILSILISRTLINATIINISTISILAYWITYPIERLEIKDMYQTIYGIKDLGIIFYILFAFSFILGLFLTSKIKIPRIKLYNDLNKINYLFFISIFLGIFGLICFSYTYNFSIFEYFNIFFKNRVERMSVLSSAKNALPYSISFIPSLTILILLIKKLRFNFNLKQKIGISLIIFINSPILISYLFEGDRTSLIKSIMVVLFILSLKNKSFEEINKKERLIENFKINKNVLFKRLKIIIALILSFIIFTFIGLGRGNGWKNISRVFKNFESQYKERKLPVAEFRSVNFTIDYAIARDHLTLDKIEKMFTWDRGIFYVLPTYVYKNIFNEKKPPNVGDAIGREVKNYLFGKEYPRKIGFGLSPISEGYINNGLLGIFSIGFIYGSFVRILQNSYNKMAIESFNFFDHIVINSACMIPLMMRAGTVGIYNWIFSITFMSFIPILIIEFLRNLKSIQNFYV